MNAWQKTLDADKASGIRFVADIAGELTRALGTEFDSASVFGTNRSKRFAIVTRDGKVERVEIEPDNTGLDGMSSFAEEDMLGPC